MSVPPVPSVSSASQKPTTGAGVPDSTPDTQVERLVDYGSLPVGTVYGSGTRRSRKTPDWETHLPEIHIPPEILDVQGIGAMGAPRRGPPGAESDKTKPGYGIKFDPTRIRDAVLEIVEDYDGISGITFARVADKRKIGVVREALEAISHLSRGADATPPKVFL